MKKTIDFLVFNLLFTTAISNLVCAQSTISGTIPVTAYTQEQSQWCWAASARMVDWSYSTTTPPSQCSIVNKANDQCDGLFNFCCSTLNGSRPSACTTPLSSNYPNSMYGCDGSLSWLMGYYAGSNTTYGSSLSSSLVTGNIGAKRLMVARWGWTNGGGHFVVLYGFIQTNGYPLNVSYANPSSGSKVTETYTYFKSNSNRTWTHTVRMNNASVRRDGSEQENQMLEMEGNMRLYPNPSDGDLRIERYDHLLSAAKLSFVNTLGQVIYEVILKEGEMQTALDLKGKLAPGLYYVTMENNGERKTEKLVIR